MPNNKIKSDDSGLDFEAQPGIIAGSFRWKLRPDIKADFVSVWKNLANPPFNMSDWGGENLRQELCL